MCCIPEYVNSLELCIIILLNKKLHFKINNSVYANKILSRFVRIGK